MSVKYLAHSRYSINLIPFPFPLKIKSSLTIMKSYLRRLLQDVKCSSVEEQLLFETTCLFVFRQTCVGYLIGLEHSSASSSGLGIKLSLDQRQKRPSESWAMCGYGAAFETSTVFKRIWGILKSLLCFFFKEIPIWWKNTL